MTAPLPVLPGPLDAPLTVTVECRTAADAPSEARHPITLHEDWSVTTPHDLEAERIGVAMGGYSSCVVLVDHTAPALRRAMGILARRGPRGITAMPSGKWSIVAPARRAGCCPSRQIPTAAEAHAHLRSDAHLLAATRAPAWQFHELRRAAEHSWGFAVAVEQCGPIARDLVSEVNGLRSLWDAGIHPSELARLAEPAAAVHDALPASYYLHLAYGTVDRDWLAAVVPGRPDPDTAAWLAGLTAAQRADEPAAWRTWLRLGLRRDDVLFALHQGLDHRAVGAVAAAGAWSQPVAAALMVTFARAGCSIGPDHAAVLARHEITRPHTSGKALDDLARFVGKPQPADGDGGGPSRTDLAIMLAVLGTTRDVAAALRSGIRNAGSLPLARA